MTTAITSKTGYSKRVSISDANDHGLQVYWVENEKGKCKVSPPRVSPAARYNWGEMGQQVNFFIPNEISHNSGENDAITQL